MEGYDYYSTRLLATENNTIKWVKKSIRTTDYIKELIVIHVSRFLLVCHSTSRPINRYLDATSDPSDH
jgi:hypothetical protein